MDKNNLNQGDCSESNEHNSAATQGSGEAQNTQWGMEERAATSLPPIPPNVPKQPRVRNYNDAVAKYGNYRQQNQPPYQPAPPFPQNPAGRPYNYPGANPSAPNPGAFGNTPPGAFPQNGAQGNNYYAPGTNVPNYGAYPYPPQKKSGTSPVVYVLIAILSVCFIAAAALCVYLFMDTREGTQQDPTTPFMQATTTAPTTAEPTTTAAPTTTAPTTTEAPTTEEPVTETSATEKGNSYEYLDELNRRHDNYFDFRPDENGHIIAHSSTRLITEKELHGMTEHQVCMARNEIYARHGYIFKTEKYNEYFKNFSWYKPTTTSLPDVSDIESQNVKIISAYESKKGW